MYVISRLKMFAAATAASTAVLTGVAWSAAPAVAPTVVASETALGTQDGASAATPHTRPKASRPSHPRAMRRSAPAAMLPGIGAISARTLQSLDLNAAQTQALDEARTATRALRQDQRRAMQDVRTLRREQLAAGRLDPHALHAAQQTAMEPLRARQQALQNQWLAVWDSFSAEQKEKIVHAVQRQDARAKRRSERFGTWRDKRG